MPKKPPLPPERDPDAEYSRAEYHRSTRPVRPRRRRLSWRRVPWRGLATVLGVAAVLYAAGYSVNAYLMQSSDFRLAGGESVRVTGLKYIPAEEIARIFAVDYGSSIAAVPLEKRREQMLAIDWVHDAVVRRVWPARLWVDIHERQPVAFARVPAAYGKQYERPMLVDAEGVLLPVPAGHAFSFPVVSGVTPDMEIAERKQRIELFLTLCSDLSAPEPNYLAEISEVDLSESDNAVLVVERGDRILKLQLGQRFFRHRYEIYRSGIEGWRQDYPAVREVDLRFKEQAVLR